MSREMNTDEKNKNAIFMYIVVVELCLLYVPYVYIC